MQLVKFLLILIVIALNIFAFTHKRYENLASGGDPNLLSLLEWKFTREKPIWPKLPKEDIKPVQNNIIPEEVGGNEILVTYINHSTYLIQMDNLNILTDPIWSEYAGPYGEFGVKRVIYPGIDIEQLPDIDFILISHSHYDHLDLPTIKKLTSRNNKPRIITGLGVSKYIDFCQASKNNCYELNWWDNIRIGQNGTIFHFVPAHHWSSRFYIDKDISLWGGFVIENGDDRVYFAGDTGFGDGRIFKYLQEQFGSFRLSLLPIGAYKPNWFFKEMHTSPDEAVQIFEMLNSNYAIPMHYDTFQLSDETYQDPLIDLSKALSAHNVASDKFNIMKPGDSWNVP